MTSKFLPWESYRISAILSSRTHTQLGSVCYSQVTKLVFEIPEGCNCLKGDVRVSFPPFSWGNGWNYFVVFNSSHSSMGCLANQRRLCPSWKWREPEPEPIEEWLELFCWLLGIAVNNLIPAIHSWKWRETDSNIPLIYTITYYKQWAYQPLTINKFCTWLKD